MLASPAVRKSPDPVPAEPTNLSAMWHPPYLPAGCCHHRDSEPAGSTTAIPRIVNRMPPRTS